MMDTIVFALILIIGGWLMYCVGHYHGFKTGKEKALDYVDDLTEFRARSFDLYDK